MLKHLTVTVYKPEHMYVMSTIVNQPGVREAPGFERWARTRGEYGPAITFLDGDEVIACCGVNIFWPGVGEVWLSLAPGCERFKKETVVLARHLLDNFQREYKLWRLQADTMNPVAQRFLEHYGFRCEGIMRHYAPTGASMARYARIRPEYLPARGER